MNSIEIFYGSSEDEDQIQELIKLRRHLRQQLNVYDLPDVEFVRNLSFSKQAFQLVLEEIALPDAIRSTAVQPAIQLAATLNVLAKGSYQHGAGNQFNLGLAQLTVSLIIKELIPLMEEKLCCKWIKMPDNDDKLQIK
ncbi:PREDICTED: uncharacterized protein LOC108368990, partial [Rhagoletis zephyria]|uniref:uncharacterized protein LOC108368990 n=1 Tax=Rhagoletis zephyria TaxID=28612 RepID=UPI0008114E00